MAGIKSGADDLDSLFKARTSPKANDVGILIGSTDISNNYEPRAGTPPRANVGWKTSKSPYAAGTDISDVFMDINYATPTPTPTPTATPTPTPEPTATPTPTPTSTPTPEPTATPTPTPTSTPTPTPTPTPCYTFEIFAGTNGEADIDYEDCNGNTQNYFYDTGLGGAGYGVLTGTVCSNGTFGFTPNNTTYNNVGSC